MSLSVCKKTVPRHMNILAVLQVSKQAVVY
jgi:hypothetical protein